MENLSLDLSKKLKELGVVVESGHVWMIPNLDMKGLTHRLGLADDFIDSKLFCVIPAPTFEELWAVMPVSLRSDDDFECGLFMDMSYNRNSNVGYNNIIHRKAVGPLFTHESPTEAAGMLLVWLAEHGHLEGK